MRGGRTVKSHPRLYPEAVIQVKSRLGQLPPEGLDGYHSDSFYTRPACQNPEQPGVLQGPKTLPELLGQGSLMVPDSGESRFPQKQQTLTQTQDTGKI